MYVLKKIRGTSAGLQVYNDLFLRSPAFRSGQTFAILIMQSCHDALHGEKPSGWRSVPSLASSSHLQAWWMVIRRLVFVYTNINFLNGSNSFGVLNLFKETFLLVESKWWPGGLMYAHPGDPYTHELSMKLFASWFMVSQLKYMPQCIRWNLAGHSQFRQVLTKPQLVCF
jgi:hypothetical protein